MSFRRISGKPRLEWYPKKTSTAFNYGGLVYPDPTPHGYIIPADSTSGNHVGVAMRKVASTDADYATTGAKIPVDVVGEDDVFEADVVGTLTTDMVLQFFDLQDDLTVNVAATAKKTVLCVGFISATRGLFKVNARAADFYVATT